MKQKKYADEKQESISRGVSEEFHFDKAETAQIGGNRSQTPSARVNRKPVPQRGTAFSYVEQKHEG